MVVSAVWALTPCLLCLVRATCPTLEEYFELKDTWLTALAIDKEDNVFSAAAKTALEGFGLGLPLTRTPHRLAWC